MALRERGWRCWAKRLGVGGEEPAQESGYNRQCQTLEKGCWGGGGKTDKSQLAPNPSRSPASSRKGLALLWEALGI